MALEELGSRKNQRVEDGSRPGSYHVIPDLPKQVNTHSEFQFQRVRETTEKEDARRLLLHKPEEP